jgi:hypothetical protein
MISIFRQSKFLPPILVPLLIVPFWIPAFLTGNIVEVNHAMPLFELLNHLLGFYFPVKPVFAWLLLLFNAFYLNYLLDHYSLLTKKSFVPALIYGLLMSLLPGFIQLHPLLPATTFLLLGFRRVMLTYRTGIDIADFFDAAFFFSVAGLFYFPSLVFIPMLWVSLIVIRPFVWREWTGMLVGSVLPFVFCFSYYFVFDDLQKMIQNKIFFPQDFLFVYPSQFSMVLWITVGFTGFFFLLSGIKFLTHTPAKTIFSRNISVIMAWWLLLAAGSYGLAPDNSLAYFSFAAVPLTYYHAHWFLEMKKIWIAELMFLLFMLVMCANHFPSLFPFIP